MTLTAIFRIIRRDSVSLLTNMTGLSIGLATTILLTMFIQYELSFDKHFAESNRIIRLNSIWTEDGADEVFPINIRGAYTQVPEQIPGIEKAIQIYRGGSPEITFENNRHKELQLLYSVPAFFDLFDFTFIHGNKSEVLKDVNEVVITEDCAQRIFGNSNPLGESIEMENEAYTISAVIENVPANTHFLFDMLMPMKAISRLEEMGGLEFFTYYLLKEGADYAQVEKSICDLNTILLTQNFEEFESSTFSSSVEALERLHLHTSAMFDLSASGSMKTIFIMLSISIIVMLLALSNFVNLYILSGAKRSKEIGIRKVNGAKRKTLIGQFYLETLVVVSISFVLGVLISLILIPEFGVLMQRETFASVLSRPILYIVILIIYVTTILLSGFYPALFLSKADVLPLIHGNVNPAGDKRLLLKIATVFQIAITLFLLTILIGINTQISFLKKLSPGYNPENIVMLYNFNQELLSHYPALNEKLKQIPGVMEVAASGHTIGRGYSGQGIRRYGDLPNQSKSVAEYRIQAGMCSLYQFDLRAGRFFDANRPSDKMGVLLNEAAVKMLGSEPEALIGESVVLFDDPMEVIGVVKDFHYESAAKKILPLVMTSYSDYIRSIAIRLQSSADLEKSLESINETIKSFDQDYIMVNLFASDIYTSYYQDEERMRTILGAGSLLSIIIVIMGIYALVSHNIISRTKELGIRKVMGGTALDLMLMIYTSTLKWTLIASILALPFCWVYLDKWLDQYTVRIPLHWWIFALSFFFVFFLETIITLGKTRKAALKNPVEGLKYE